LSSLSLPSSELSAWALGTTRLYPLLGGPRGRPEISDPRISTGPVAGTSGSVPRDTCVNRRASEARHRPFPSLFLTHWANIRHLGRESLTGSSTVKQLPSPLGHPSVDESSSGEEIAPIFSGAAAMLAA
jgi:hypothetical protein